jgi:acetyltransferase
MLESLLYPDTVAVIGASRTPGKVGHDILANLIDCGFNGRIVPVNPFAEKVLGLTCCGDLKTYEGAVDLSVIAVPAEMVRNAVESSIQAGAKAVAIITAGFKEASAGGAELEREIARICSAQGVRLLGPNSSGLINTHHMMNASIIPNLPRAGGISVISQSGAVCTAIMDWAARGHLGLAKIVGIGNRADLTEIDLLEALSADEQTTVIMGYLESISSGDEFVKAAETAASVKPVVILKAGTTNAGMRAASSHTGSLAGSDMAYGAAFNRSGVIRADSFEKLLDYRTGDPAPAQGQPCRHHKQRIRTGHPGRRRGRAFRHVPGHPGGWYVHRRKREASFIGQQGQSNRRSGRRRLRALHNGGKCGSG